MQQQRRRAPQLAPSRAVTTSASCASWRGRATSMVLNTRMAQTSFEIREQQLALNELEAKSWTMRAELDRKASPTELERAAKANGMVPAGSPGFISLDKGTVEGGTPAK